MSDQSLRILLVDDNEDDYLVTQNLLEDIGAYPYELEWTSSYARATEAMIAGKHDVYLIDYRLGHENGLNLLQWAISSGIDAPIIVLIGQNDQRVDRQAMTAGAVDYLEKGGFDAQLLERSIRYAVGQHRAQSERLSLETELRQAQKMEAIGHMAGGIAHDFNNILTTILSYASLARRQVDPDHDIYRMLVGIRDSGQLAANLTHQLLAFASRQFVAPRPLDLNEVVNNLVNLLGRLINAEIDLIVEPDPDLKPILADPGQMEQVLVNLILNARDALPDGGEITVRTTNEKLAAAAARKMVEAKPGDYVCLEVSDTGVGMTPAVRARIFDPFFTTKEPGKGTGLGLSTCYGIVKQSGGFIHVETKLGEGTRFKIYLPRTKEVAFERLTPDQARLLPEGNETLLLVEDEVTVREVVAEMLAGRGYTVITVAASEEALRLLTNQDHEEPIDLLLTAVVLPGLSGIVLADKIKDKYPALKIIFMSGYSDESIARQQALLEAGTYFIQKPFTLKKLARQIRQILDT